VRREAGGVQEALGLMPDGREFRFTQIHKLNVKMYFLKKF
jgi:hypothetical protein